ncbi:hypothetical protein ABFS82_13G016700 [Erythranthe guttata]
MSDAKNAKFSLNFMTNKQRTKVLFAEADSSFTDVLISFLTLPLGTIIRILKQHYGEEASAPVFGCLNTLYNGLSNLDVNYFWTEGCKEMLLNPISSFEAEYRKLKLDINETMPAEYFICESPKCGRKYPKILHMKSVYYDTATCVCGAIMTRNVVTNKECQADVNCGGVFTVSTESFVISDDLRVFPNTRGFTQTLRNLGITNMDLGELRHVTFGFSEIMDLLKGSLLSRTPLTDIILGKRKMEYYDVKIKSEPGILCHEIDKEENSYSKKMILKVMVQKSTNKFLFAQSNEDFVDFLCSLPAIPLGGVEYLLGSNSCFTCVSNLYRSVADNIDYNIADIHNNYLVCGGNMKDRLMKPKLPHGYITKNPILRITEEDYPRTECYPSFGTIIFDSVKFSREQGEYTKGSKMYKITDDLTVTPLCMTAIISDLKELKIPLSDIKELELEIRSDEALRILRASLTSTSALSDALINGSMLNKQCISTGFGGGKLVQGLRIEFWQPQCGNFKSNEGWFLVGTRSGSATLTGR